MEDTVLKKFKRATELAMEFGITTTTIQRWVKRFDVPYLTDELGNIYFNSFSIEMLKTIKGNLDKGYLLLEVEEILNDEMQKNIEKPSSVKVLKELITGNYIFQKGEEIEVTLEKEEAVAIAKIILGNEN